MNVKSRNMIEVVLQIAFLICLFFQVTRWTVSFVDYLVGLIAIAILALLIMQAVSKGNKSNQLYVVFLPIIEIVLFLGAAVLGRRIETLFVSKLASTGSYILFYITIAILLLLTGIAIPTYFKANKLGIIEEQPAVNNISHAGNADELKKLKSLLDCGAITEEEFQTKKVELLKR